MTLDYGKGPRQPIQNDATIAAALFLAVVLTLLVAFAWAEIEDLIRAIRG
jgi:hypothetical protein